MSQKTIKSITAAGLFYVEENGEERFVSFDDCNENWLAYRKRKENLSEDEISRLEERDKIVGQRDSDPECFIEFFTRPFLRFEFETAEEKAIYHWAWCAVWESGWKTIDWS